MSQNQLITILTIVLLIVIGASMFVLFGSSPATQLTATSEESSDVPVSSQFKLEVLEQQAYQLLNKQLIREGALPVKPPVIVGKANPFL